MLYDYRAHGTKAGQLPVFSRASSFVEILISRGRIFHTVAPFLSRSQIFFFLCFSLWSQLAASNSFVVQLTIAIALRFIVAYSPVHPSIIIIVSPRYRFGTINKSVFVAQCHETMAATDWSLTFKATLVPRVLHAAAGQVARPTDRPTEHTVLRIDACNLSECVFNLHTVGTRSAPLSRFVTRIVCSLDVSIIRWRTVNPDHGYFLFFNDTCVWRNKKLR